MAEHTLLSSWNVGDFMGKLKALSANANKSSADAEQPGVNSVNSNVKSILGKSIKEVSKILLDSDIRRFKSLITGMLPSDINTVQSNTITGPFFLQVIKVDNIAQPSYNQHGDGGPSRMLRVTMTDSTLKITGVEYESLKKINLSTPPGTKVLLLGNIFVRNGKVLLNSQNIKVLGGEVRDLVESWRLKEQMDAARRAGISIVAKRGGGPPPFEIGVKNMKPSSKKTEKARRKGDKKQTGKVPAAPHVEAEPVFVPPKSNYQGPSLTQMVSGGFARKTAEQLKAEALENEENRNQGYKKKQQHEKRKSVEQKVEDAIAASERMSLNASPDFVAFFEELKSVKTKKSTQIPLKLQNMEVVEPSKKQNHGVMLAFTAEDINGTIVRLAADEGLFTYLAGCQDGGMMGMGLAQMGRSKTGINYLKSTIQSIRPSLVNNALFMFHVEEPLRCIEEGNMALSPNKWAIVKQIEEVPPNVMDVLVLRFPQKLRSSAKQKKKDGGKHRNNGSSKSQQEGRNQANKNPQRNGKKSNPNSNNGKKKQASFFDKKKTGTKGSSNSNKAKTKPANNKSSRGGKGGREGKTGKNTSGGNKANNSKGGNGGNSGRGGRGGGRGRGNRRGRGGRGRPGGRGRGNG